MKRHTKMPMILLLCLCSIGNMAQGQNHEYIEDTATRVVQRYLDILNHANISEDSVVYVESYIYTADNPHDTIVLKRWLQPPLRFRIEMYHGDTLLSGCYSDDIYYCRRYNPDKHGWYDATNDEYKSVMDAYDIRGPLWKYRYDGTQLYYAGTWKYKDQEVYRIRVHTPYRYDRFYLFEKESGLLFLIDELDTHDPDMIVTGDKEHIKWRACHEYQPVGDKLFPSVESFQIGGTVTYLFHHTEIQEADYELYKNDVRP